MTAAAGRPATLALPDPKLAARLLAQAGITDEDMPIALDAVSLCHEAARGRWSVEIAAEFVATAAAIGGITGRGLLLIRNLVYIAMRA